eukprot:366488-Chlamydomonas_euryale.AAC.4
MQPGARAATLPAQPTFCPQKCIRPATPSASHTGGPCCEGADGFRSAPPARGRPTALSAPCSPLSAPPHLPWHPCTPVRPASTPPGTGADPVPRARGRNGGVARRGGRRIAAPVGRSRPVGGRPRV